MLTKVYVAVMMLTCAIMSRADSVSSDTIYAMSAGNTGVQVYNDKTGALINTIDTPEMQQNNGRGVVKVGDVLYYTAASSSSVFAYNIQTKTDLGALFTVAGTSGLATIAYDGTNLFLGDYSGTNNVYKYSLGGTLLATVPLPQCTSYCDGLEFAQGHLVSNEEDGYYGTPSSYDEYDLNGKLTQKGFIKTSFGGTGVAFDGADYWVSDIYGGKLDEYSANGTFVMATTLQSPTYLVEDLSFDYSQVIPSNSPEPATVALLGLGLAATAIATRRRKASR